MQSTLPVSAAPTSVSPQLQQQAAVTRLAYLGISEQRSGDIEIQTADGDTVEITFADSSEANLLTYRHLAYSGDGYEAERLQVADVQEESEFTISFVGQKLDDREIADIQALLKDLAQTLKQFLLGNTRAAEAHAPEAGGSIRSYTADFTVERGVTAVEALQARTAVSPADVPGKVEPQRVEAPAASAAAPPAEPIQPPVPVAEAPVQQMAERVQEHRPTRRMLRHLKKMLKALLKGMRTSGEIDDRQAATGREVLDALFRKLAPQGGEGAAIGVSATRVSVRREWASVRYASSASLEPAAPQLEETA